MNQILTGDAKELSQHHIKPNTVDLVLCDPVYWDIDFYEFVAAESARILKPGGSCIVQLGQYYLPDVLLAMQKHLEYYWIDSQRIGVNSRMWNKKIFANWKPHLWFWKPGEGGRLGGWAVDSVYAPRDKASHVWGDGWQLYGRIIEDLTGIGDLVVDFCAGGGTVPAACKRLQRNFIAFEINAETAEAARHRVLKTPVTPTFLPNNGINPTEQASLFPQG